MMEVKMRFYANVLLSRLVNETFDWFREKTRKGSIVPVNPLRISLQKHQRSLQSRCKRYTNITQLAHNTPSIGRTFKNIVFASFHRNGYLLFSIDLLFVVQYLGVIIYLLTPSRYPTSRLILLILLLLQRKEILQIVLNVHGESVLQYVGIPTIG